MNINLSGFSDEISSNVQEQFKVLNKLNIKFFEPRGIDGKNISTLTDNEAEILKGKMEQYNIKASSIGSPIGKIKISDDFAPHFELFKRVVALAKALDSKYIRIFSFYADGGWNDTKRMEVLSRLKMMIEYAREKGVVLLHENEKGIYGDTTNRCLDLMNELYCDNFRAVFDPANFVQCGEDTKKAYEAMKPYIEYMHIKDAKPDGEAVPSGFGAGNIEYILKELFANGYNGFLSLEPHLGDFEGLAGLEQGKITEGLPEGGEGTFTLAYNALKDILEKI